MVTRLNTGKNIRTGKKVNVEDMDSITRKTMLYKILEVKGSDKEIRYDFSIASMSFLTATSELFYRYPDVAKLHEGHGSEEEDFYAMMVVCI